MPHIFNENFKQQILDGAVKLFDETLSKFETFLKTFGDRVAYSKTTAFPNITYQLSTSYWDIKIAVRSDQDCLSISCPHLSQHAFRQCYTLSQQEPLRKEITYAVELMEHLAGIQGVMVEETITEIFDDMPVPELLDKILTIPTSIRERAWLEKEVGTEYDTPYANITLRHMRPETKEEVEQRIAEKLLSKQNNEQRERNELARLKAKYET